jgi:hypothetical protein
MAQGGTGVISDADMKAFWDRIGGLGEKSEQWVMNVLSGKIAPEKRAEVAAAVRELAGRATANLSDIRGAMDHAFGTSKNFAGYKDQMVGTYFSGARQKSAGGGGKVMPKEGDVKTLSSGRKVVLRGGKYVPE